MADKKFAFELGEVSIAFTVTGGLGDSIIAKKILTAAIELAPNCFVDLSCVNANHKLYADTFYSDIKN